MKYKHVIWDWNGTLLDDAWLCVDILNGLLSRRGKAPVTLSGYAEMFRFPVEDYYRGIGFDFSNGETYHDVTVEFIGIYNKRRFECDLQKDARKVLEIISDAGIEQSLLSAYRQDALEEVVRHFGLKKFFIKQKGLEDYYASGKVETAKDHAGELGLEGENVVLLGDTMHDAEVADGIGASCILVPSGHNSRERLESTGLSVPDSLMGAADLLVKGV